jgi:dGTPase
MTMASDHTDIAARMKTFAETQELRMLAPAAAFSTMAVRRQAEQRLKSGYRQAYAVDADRIMHSLAYARYIDKTQVFYLIKNDHITHRVLHVQLVSKIARTIGRFLRLNEDLIEAIALGHDIGHPPFGHDGERMLSRLCGEHGIGEFHHNAQSVAFLETIERKGLGWNLCLQTLDGILCHDGESHDRHLRPHGPKDFDIHRQEIDDLKQGRNPSLIPMTLEGCVVRMADTISYIGRDIEDAIRLNLLRRDQLPDECTRVLGATNGTMIHRLVTDLIDQSHDQAYVAYSRPVAQALKQLKSFNLKYIYLNPRVKQWHDRIESLYRMLFERYLDDLKLDNRDSVIYGRFLHDMAPDYIQNHDPPEMVRDFLAGMTDRYFLMQVPESQRPPDIELPAPGNGPSA